ncbi:hypothetical protein N7481_002455 [Penicillium waksmanii]|uniref:uncharacterized protein n=1 Tax=Penicillium waksmanii TaxID=69791 RepID=UPI00254954F7|nr:uncharacterized protein N7481_002455 [Penicillium waksmanii]KAJ5995478.1 hypothetical protein N7481_002455 [Penicillium waksmanii]
MVKNVDWQWTRRDNSKQAAAIAALSSEVVFHPLDTMITRMQCKDYSTVYKHSNGSLRRALFTGLYQGFGPTLFAGIPSSAAFFATYEVSKTSFERAQRAGYLPGVPKSIFHAISSAAAELVACAFLNPAEVLKQNAQVSQQSANSPKGGPPASIIMLKSFYKQPSALWSGYWMLVAGQLPNVCLTFCLYESFKESLYEKQRHLADTTMGQIQASVLCAGVAGGCSSWFFVPIDVVKTRMRLALGDEMQLPRSPWIKPSALSVAQDVFTKEGIPGFFRGSQLTCIAAIVCSAMYIGSYEGVKLCLGTSDPLS